MNFLVQLLIGLVSKYAEDKVVDTANELLNKAVKSNTPNIGINNEDVKKIIKTVSESKLNNLNEEIIKTVSEKLDSK